MAVATTYYDSTSKKDSENEFLLWIELKKDSEKILKNFTELIDIASGANGKTLINFECITSYLDNFSEDIAKMEVYYDKEFTEVKGLPQKCGEAKDLNSIFQNK